MYTNKHFNFIFFFFNLKTLINCKKIAAISSVFGIPKTEVKENFTFIFIQNIFRLIIFSNLKKKKRMSLWYKDFVFQRLTISNIICISNFDMGQLNFWTSKLNLFCYNFVLLYIVIHGTILRVHSIAILVL